MLIQPSSGACDLFGALFHGFYCCIRIEVFALVYLFSGECLVVTYVVVLESVFLQILADLTQLNVNNKHRLITLDINNLYVNIAIAETIDITTTQLLKHNDPETTTQICTLLGVIMQQNYFIFKSKFTNPIKE